MLHKSTIQRENITTIVRISKKNKKVVTLSLQLHRVDKRIGRFRQTDDKITKIPALRKKKKLQERIHKSNQEEY